jgi:hypothetical protein
LSKIMAVRCLRFIGVIICVTVLSAMKKSISQFLQHFLEPDGYS